MKRSEFLRLSVAGVTMVALPRPGAAQGDASGALRAGLKLSPTSMDPHFRLSGEPVMVGTRASE